jgi:hypothetical protein
MCDFIFFLYILFATFIILKRIQQDIIKIVYWSSCKVLVIMMMYVPCIISQCVNEQLDAQFL